MPSTLVCVHGLVGFLNDEWRALESADFNLISVVDPERAVAAVQEESADLLLLSPEFMQSHKFRNVEKALEALTNLDLLIPVVCCDSRNPTRSKEQSVLDSCGVVRLDAALSPEQFVLQLHSLIKGEATAGLDGGAGQRLPTSGDFRELRYGALLSRLYRMKVRGVVCLGHGKKKKAIEFRDGSPVAVQSNLLSECLGNRLMESGTLSRRDWEESVRRLRQGEGLQGQILLDMGVVKPADLQRALDHQAEAKILEVFGWRTGRYQFEPGKKLGDRVTRLMAESPNRLIRKAAHQLIPLNEIDLFLTQHAKSGWRFGSDWAGSLGAACDQEDWSQYEAELDPSLRLGEYVEASESTRRALYAVVMMGFYDVPELVGRTFYNPTSSETLAPEVSSQGGGVEWRGDLLEWARKLRGQDAYSILGVPVSTHDQAVQRAYMRLSEKVRPHEYQNAPPALRQLADEVFRLLTGAHSKLQSVRSRAEYAATLRKETKDQEGKVQRAQVHRAERDFREGEQCLKQRAYVSGLECFGRALQVVPDSGLYRAFYGWALHLCHPDDLMMTEEAIEHVREGARLDREHHKPLVFLGRLYVVQGRWVAAEKILARAVELSPDSVEAQRELRLLTRRRRKGHGGLRRIFKFL